MGLRASCPRRVPRSACTPTLKVIALQSPASVGAGRIVRLLPNSFVRIWQTFASSNIGCASLAWEFELADFGLLVNWRRG